MKETIATEIASGKHFSIRRWIAAAILIAIAASMGIPFVISTPPNAMVYGEGVRSSDLLVPGLILMILGCLLVALTGPFVLRLMGMP